LWEWWVLEDFFWLWVLEDFFWLWGSLDNQGASSMVTSSFSFPRQMWSSDPFGDFLSAANNVKPTQGGATVVPHYRHGLEVEDEGNLKDFFVISIFIEVLWNVIRFFIARFLFTKRCDVNKTMHISIIT
jgi:hypothetical protein